MKAFLQYIAAALALSPLLFASCSKESTETMFGNQEARIETYINSLLSSNESAFVVYNGGSARVTVARTSESADSLSSSGTVALYYAGYVFSGSVSASSMFVTNYKEVAESASWNLSGEDTFEVKVLNLGSDSIVDGLRKGLEGVKAGDECYILFSGKYGFGKKPLGTIPANSALAYHVWVEGISNE